MGAEIGVEPLLNRLRRALDWAPDADGRVIMLAVVASYFAIIAIGRTVWGIDFWPLLGVPSGPSLFFDARNLTAAWESQRLGYDALYESPCDPWGRPLMYLRPWLLLEVLGLDQSHTSALAVVLIGAMFLSYGAIVGRVTGGTAIVLALAACSPAVMFAVERANMDVALFSVVAASVLLWGAYPAPARVVSPIIVLLAATAKIYPIFAMPAFLVAGSPLAVRATLVCFVVFGIYAAATFRDIAHVATIATQGEFLSYGARILPAHVYHQIGADHWPGPAALKQLIAMAPLGIAGAVLGVHVRRRLGPLDCKAAGTARLLALHVGALIYLGTFAAANNFDYRLVFLLLALPQLLEWAREPTHQLTKLAAATLFGILALLWIGSLSEWLNLWDELASWVVAGLLAAVLAATMPPMPFARTSIRGN